MVARAALLRDPGRMRRRVLGLIVAALMSSVLMAASGLPSQASGPAEPAALTTLCLVPKNQPDHETTVRVPAKAAEILLSRTLSYRGVCAEYGASADLGEGTLTAYSQRRGDRPESVGLSFPARTLRGLPTDPPTQGTWCFDKDGDGTVDPMMECTGGYENALPLNEQFLGHVNSPFTYLLVNWNPMGHMPPHVYDLPHFDIHFYLNENDERLAIRPGPCPALVNCEDYTLGKLLPAAKYRTADHVDLDAIEPGMGNHLIDTTGPEFHGERFTHAYIHGSWNSHLTFLEPMVTHEWFAGLVDGTRSDACFVTKQPQAWEVSGWYPTSYCLRYRENRDELTASLEGFVYRQAG